jgi:hypothetical protein
MNASDALPSGAGPFNVASHWRLAAVVCAIAGCVVWLFFAAVASRHERMYWNDWLRVGGQFWTLAFGLLLAWRRPESYTVRLLSAALLLYSLFDGILVVGEAVPGARVHGSATVAVGEFGIAVSSCVIMAQFASQFALPLSRLRRWCLVLVYAASVGTVLGAGLMPFVAGSEWLYAFTDLGHYAAPRFAVLLCGIVAIAASQNEERQRVGWPFASFGVLYVASIGGFIGALPQVVFDALVRLAIFVIPIGITYSALSRRLYDVGFIVNRAVAFSSISGIVIGSFVLLEWTLGKWFDQAGREAGLAANIALALAFGLSLRLIHRRVERFVDTVFFKKRNEDVSALKRFAQEAAFITDRETLLERTRAQVLEHSETSSVSITMADEAAATDLNDPAILAMRTWHDAIELHRYDTALAGEYAFPMFGRGSLLGVLVCGAKRSGEAFAPDEIDALKALAYGVGVALDALDRAVGDETGSMVAAFASLRNDVMARLDALVGEGRTVSRDSSE